MVRSLAAEDPPSQGGQSPKPLCLAFPNHYDLPTQSHQLSSTASISFPVPPKLVGPELQVSFRPGGPATAGVPVPIASVHEDHRPVTLQNDVRAAGQTPHVHSESQTASMEVPADGQLRRGIPVPHGSHSGADRSCGHVWVRSVAIRKSMRRFPRTFPRREVRSQRYPFRRLWRPGLPPRP